MRLYCLEVYIILIQNCIVVAAVKMLQVLAKVLCNCKWSKILNTFLFLLSTKMLVNRDGIHKLLVRIANSENPDQTVSLEAVWSGSALFV